jgi:hypothetical protein
MAIPASTEPLRPPLSSPTAAAEARDGFAPAEATPLHRSAAALRVEATGPESAAGAVLFADEREELLALALLAARLARGAVELLNTAWSPARVTPAVAPLVRAVTELRFAAGARVAAGVRGACAGAVERC